MIRIAARDNYSCTRESSIAKMILGSLTGNRIDIAQLYVVKFQSRLKFSNSAGVGE